MMRADKTVWKEENLEVEGAVRGDCHGTHER